jgi:uncharacterized repeat protein (TIGR03803 family)
VTLFNFGVFGRYGSTDGEYPSQSLTLGSDGNFYGTTAAGGGSEGNGNGTIFKMVVVQ